MSCDPITYAYLETTNHCNLDCVFCNRRDVVTQKTLKHMSLEDWDRILNILGLDSHKNISSLRISQEEFMNKNLENVVF